MGGLQQIVQPPSLDGRIQPTDGYVCVVVYRVIKNSLKREIQFHYYYEYLVLPIFMNTRLPLAQ